MSTHLSSASTGEEVAQTFSGQIRGKTILITGGSVGGIGLECAAEVAKHSPKSIILTARTKEKLAEAVAYVRERAADAPIHPITLELSSLKDVRRAAEEINQLPGAIDVLLHNAGIAAQPHPTEDGLPMVYTTNVYAPFLLTKLLLPKLLQSAHTPRVIFIAGGQPTPTSRFRVDDPYCRNVPEGEKFQFYTESKIADWLLASAVARKAEGKVIGIVTSPGWVASQLSRYLPRERKIAMGFIDENGVQNPNMRTLQQGCAPYLVSAFHPDDAYGECRVVNGAYITSDCKAEPDKVPVGAQGQDKQDGLWNVCETVVGEKFDF